MRIKGLWFLSLTAVLCTAQPVIAKSNSTSTTNPIIERNKMFFSAKAETLKPEDYLSYAPATVEILRTHFKKDEAYILHFMQFAKKAKLTLDPLFLGLKDSKKFTANEAGYSTEQQQSSIDFLQLLVEQQFKHAAVSSSPTYHAIAGGPGTGKTFALKKAFAIDVPKQFANNAVTIGPDLIVMHQMAGFNKAGTIANDAERAAAMKLAYSIDRDTSNYIANFMLAMAITDGRNVVHDSTLTSDTVGDLLGAIHENGYTLQGKALFATSADRINSLELRTAQNRGFALVTPEDASKKAYLSFTRIQTYAASFDTFTLCMQPEGFFEGKEPIAVAQLNPETRKMEVLPGQRENLALLVNEARQEKDLDFAKLAEFEAYVSTWTDVTPKAKSTLLNIM